MPKKIKYVSYFRSFINKPSKNLLTLSLLSASLVVLGLLFSALSWMGVLYYGIGVILSVFSIVKFREYVLSHIERKPLSNISLLEKEVYKHGFEGQSSWKNYFTSYLTAADWRYPIPYYAGLSADKIKEVESKTKTKEGVVIKYKHL